MLTYHTCRSVRFSTALDTTNECAERDVGVEKEFGSAAAGGVKNA